MGGLNTNTTFAGVINATNAISLVKNGTGTQTLSGANTYTGKTTISAGILRVGSATALGANTAAVTVTSGAVLDLNGTAMTNTNALTLNGTGISSGGALTNSSSTAGTYAGLITLGVATTIASSSGNIIINNAGTIGGGFALTLGGSATGSKIASIIGTGANTVTENASGGTWTLSGANTYTGGTTISAGTLKVGGATALGTNAGAVSVILGAVLDLNGTTMTNTNPLTLNGTGISNGGVLINSSTTAGTYAGLVTLGSDSSILTTSGNITLSNAGTIGGAHALTLGGAATGTINSIIGTAVTSVTENATGGTWILAGANTYTGATTVSAGTLLVNGSIASGSSVSVSSGATLGGGVGATAGTVNGTVSDSGIIDPGSSSTANGILKTGAVTFNSGAALNIQLDGTAPGTGYDQLNGLSTVALGTNIATLNVSVTSGFNPANLSTYTILSSTGALSGTFNGLANNSVFQSSTGQYFLITYTGNSVVLNDEQAPTVTASPSAQSVNAGQSATFTAAATNYIPNTVQWWVSTNGGSSFSSLGTGSSPYSGTQTTTLTISNSTGLNTYQYEAVFTNAAGSATSSAATLTVDSITTQPISLTGTASQNATFAAATSQSGDTVQWYVSTNGGSSFTSLGAGSAPYSGTQTTTLTITNLSTTLDNYQYEAIFSNSSDVDSPNTLTTNAATLSVLGFSSTPTINIANKGNVTVSGISGTGDTISVVIADSASHTTTAATATVSGGTWTVSGIDASGLADGAVTYSVTDSSHNLTTLTQTATKYTVAPVVAFTTTPIINVANYTSLTVSGHGDNGYSISVVIHDTASHTTTAATTTVSGGSWSVSGINASSINDGTVTYAVTETDTYANSTTVTQNEPKITRGPQGNLHQHAERQHRQRRQRDGHRRRRHRRFDIGGHHRHGQPFDHGSDDHRQRRHLVGQRHRCQRSDRRFSYLLGHGDRRGRQQHHDYTSRGEDRRGPHLGGSERPVHQQRERRQRHGQRHRRRRRLGLRRDYRPFEPDDHVGDGDGEWRVVVGERH